MVNLDRVKAKINALLSKTVENGATKEEMNSALAKANELMLEFFITEHDLKKEKDKDVIVKCVSKTVDLVKTHYDLSIFHYSLNVLFDCKSFTTTNEKLNSKGKKSTYQTSTIFGYETDVEMCCYFLQMIERSCMREKKWYMNSFDYMCDRKHTNGKTLVSSFIMGFLFEVQDKLQELYKERKRSIPQSYGLMVIEKEVNVRKQYEDFILFFNVVNARKKTYYAGSEKAYHKGVQRGNEFELIQGLEEDNDDEIGYLDTVII